MKTGILFLSHSSELNGAELMLLDLIKAINRTKFRPVLVVPRPGPLLEKAEKHQCESLVVPMKWHLTEKAGIWKQPISRVLNIRSARKIVRTSKEKGIHLIFSNSAAIFSGAFAAKKLNIPHVWSIHEILSGDHSILHYLWGPKKLANLISGMSCCVMVNSRASRQIFERHPNIRMVYNGFQFESGNFRERKEAKKTLGLKTEDVTLGIIGKIYDGKGQKEAILAVERLCLSFPSIRLFVIGTVKDHSYHRELKKLIRRNGLRDRIIFTGQVPNVFYYLNAMDMLIAASRVESFGRTAVEAMAARTPVIALKTSGFTEIITHKWNGYLIDSTHPETIKKAVEELIDDQSLNSRIIKNGLQTYKDRFSLENHVRQVEDIIDSCLNGKKDHA